MREADVIIVGAGLSGLIAAKNLKEQGITNVLIIEKNNRIGGRLATIKKDEATADYGAQYFTAFTEPFQNYASQWIKKGWIKKWFGGTHPRYYSINGMWELAIHLAEDVEVKLNVRVEQIIEAENGYCLQTHNGEYFSKGVIVTAPFPKAESLISKLPLSEEVKGTLDSIQYEPCIVAVVQLDKPSKIDSLGLIDSKLPNGVERVIDHYKKGISNEPTVSVYMTNEWSKQHLDYNPEVLLAQIFEKIKPKVLNDAKIVDALLKKWRYSEAVKVVPSLTVDAKLAQPLFFGGDAYLAANDPSKRARFESAVLSGIALSRQMAKALNK